MSPHDRQQSSRRQRLLGTLNTVTARMAVVVIVALSTFGAGVPAAADTGVNAVPGGAGVLTVTLEPVLINTNTPQTTAGNGAAGTAATTIGYNVSYSCSVAACAGATIQLSPGPKDPTYDNYRHLLYRNWTAPFVGATIGGNDATGKLITLGDLTAGASGTFPVSYNWNTTGASMTGAQFFGNGYPIVMTATGDSTSISTVATAAAEPVIWQSVIRAPALGISNPGNRTPGTDVQYLVSMNSGCLPLDAGYPRGDSRFTCAKSYEVIDYLDPRATFVSANLGGVYDAASHSVKWVTDPAPGTGYPAPGPGWYATGSSNGNAPRTVTVNYSAAAFSPSGTDANFCDFTQTVTNRSTMHMVFLGPGGMADNDTFRDLEVERTHDIVCVNPFTKGIFISKATTFDGPSRYPNGDSPLVVRPDAAPNKHRWDISVANQSNVTGRAVIAEPNLAIEGTRPYQIVGTNSAGAQQNDTSIAWTLNTGATGTSMGVANAPAGSWFTAATITSGDLVGPNLLATGTARTTFMARIYYDVAGNAPIGATRTNTATASMTFPDYPAVPTLDLGSKEAAVQYVAAFGRGASSKSTNASTQTQLSIPTTGTTNGNYWRILARNTGNVPGRPIIEDNNLGSTPMRVTTVAHSTTSGGSAGTSLTYTLNTGATATVPLPFTAPAGTWITSVRVVGSLLDPVNALESQTSQNSWYEVRLGYAVPSTTVHNSTWTNTAAVTMTYPDMNVADVVMLDQTSTVTFVDATIVIPPVDERARINAGVAGVVVGGGSAVPGRDVVFTVRANSSNVIDGATFSPQYAFIAPANWMIVPGSATFPDNNVPPGVTYTYKTVVISGITRQAVIAQWPAGEEFGANTNPMPNMSVLSQPTSLAAPGSSGIATARIGESTNNWTTTQAVYGGAVVDTIDIDADGDVAEGFAAANAAAIPVGSAGGLIVLKEICSPDANVPGGCLWLSDPSKAVGVDPNATNIKYRLTVMNSANTTLSNMVGYDILPYLNDFGTSDATSSTPRGSTFRETIGSVSDVSAGLSVTYSASTNPPRPEVYSGATIGAWSAGVAGAQALRLSYPGNLAPGASVSMMYNANVQANPANGAMACNSLAVRITGIGTVSEPSPVCAKVAEADLAVTLPADAELQIGRPAVINVTAKNISGAASSTATVTVAVPAGLTVTNLTPVGWTCAATPAVAASVIGAATLDCTPGSELPTGVPVALPLEVIPTAANICVEVTIAGPSFDSNPANDNAEQCFAAAPRVSGITLAKTDGTATAQVGDTLTYEIRVTNELLFESIIGAVVTDELPAGLSFVSASDGGALAGNTVTWNLAALAADSTTTVTVTVVVTDTIANTFVNHAAVVANDPAYPVVTLSDDALDTNNTARMTLTKTGVSDELMPVPGDLVTYTFVVVNTGGAPLTGIDISDTLAGLSNVTFSSWPGTAGTLAPGASVTATATYSLTAANIDAGVVTNAATASGRTVDSTTVEAVDSVDVPLPRETAVTLEKTATAAGSTAGDLVSYTFVITNDGNVTLTGVALTDPLAGLSAISYQAWPGAVGVLRAGESVTATASYVATQADVDDGSLTNTATATATSVIGAPAPAVDDATVTFAANAGLSMDKSAALSGSVISYTFTSQNTGNVTLTGVTIADPLAGLSALNYTWPGAAGLLAPGQTVTATATYNVAQADIDSGSVKNTAVITGTTPSGATTDKSDAATVPFIANPNLTFDKTVTGTPALGSVLTYTFTLANTGNVTLTGAVVNDPLAGLSGLTYLWPGVAGVLAPNQSATATATYTITQADIDRGNIVNTATAGAKPPVDAALTRTDTVTVTIAQNSSEPVVRTGGQMASTGTDPRGALVLAGVLLGLGMIFLLAKRGKRKPEELL